MSKAEKPIWARHPTVVSYVRKWLQSHEGIQILPVQNYVQPLKVDLLTKKFVPDTPDFLFTLYEVKVSRKDLQRAPYQLETCRAKLEDLGLTECYVVIPWFMVDELDIMGEYSFFISAMKRFGFGVVTYPPNIITYPPTIYLSARVFKRQKSKT